MKLNYYDINNTEIPEIRFLPMSKKDEFETYEEAVEFLSEEMVRRGGIYKYRTSNLKCKEGSLILFQYDGKLIASASFLENVKYKEPNDVNKGYFLFDVDSIRIFKEPITSEEFSYIDGSFKNFNQSTRKTDLLYLKDILQLINTKINNFVGLNNTILTEEIDENERGIPEGAKKQIIVNAYERNREAREKCIEYYKKLNHGIIKCEICGFDFSEVYGEEFGDKIHIHHIKELSEIGKEYKVDPIHDLLPVCPNCHMILHSKKTTYTPKEVINLLRREK